jgi:hypothetical protein
MTDLHELEPKRSAILNQELTIIKEATKELDLISGEAFSSILDFLQDQIDEFLKLNKLFDVNSILLEENLIFDETNMLLMLDIVENFYTQKAPFNLTSNSFDK